MTHVFRGDSAAARDALDSARSALEPLVMQRPEDERLHRALARVHAGLGQSAAAIRHAQRATELLPVSRDAYWGPGFLRDIGLVYAMVGESDRAIETLEQWLAVPGGGGPVRLLTLDPRFDNLRDHPRFQALLERAMSPAPTQTDLP